MDDKELAAVGPEDFVLGFQLAGVDRIRATTPESYEEAITDLLGQDDIGIVIARQQDVDDLTEETRTTVTDSVDPVVIQLGGNAGEGLREKIRSAIGIDLMRE
jgi:V/A-type H+-transporting ATPase subunit F